MNMLSAWEQKIYNQKAWERFLTFGLPQRGSEGFRSVRRLSTLYEKKYSPPLRGNFSYTPREGDLCFLNGLYQEKYSRPHPDLLLAPLAEMAKSCPIKHTSPFAEQEKDPFVLLNHALASDPFCIYVPPDKRGHSTIHHFVSPTETPTLVLPRLLLYLGSGANLECKIEHHAHQWVCSTLEVGMEREAFLNLSTLYHNHPTSFHFDAVRALLAEGSSLTSFSLARGSALSRQDYQIALQGPSASAKVYGISQVDAERHHHIHLRMEHRAPHTTSRQHFKHLLEGRAHASFEGKIVVEPGADKTEAYQLHQSILLSDTASVKSAPLLHIFADDVKASHGATVGYLEEETLFYLQTRGLSRKEAEAMLLVGFCQDLLQQTPFSLKDLHVSL